MTFNPIHAMALKSVQIDIPAQSITSSTILTLGSITDSSIITVSSNTISLPTGRDYFLTASLNFGQSIGTNAKFAFINASGGATFSNQAQASLKKSFIQQRQPSIKMMQMLMSPIRPSQFSIQIEGNYASNKKL